MKIAGIVCEYNPMHNGHLFHINRTRQNGATHILFRGAKRLLWINSAERHAL